MSAQRTSGGVAATQVRRGLMAAEDKVIVDGLPLSPLSNPITDAQHGARGGDTQHANATGVNAGFMSAVDKARFDTIPATADILTVAGAQTISGAKTLGPAAVALGSGAAVADAAGGAVIDAEARAAINALLARLRQATGQGLIAG